MRIAYNKTWIFFVASEQQGKTYQTKKILNGILASKKCTQEQFLILDPNDKFGEYSRAVRVVPSISEYTAEYLDYVLLGLRAEKNVLFVGDDVDVFLKSGFESKEIDMLGKTIKQQSIGGILHTHRAKFFNSRIYQICDYVLVGYGLNDTDVKHLTENAGLDPDVYAKLRPRQFVLISRTDRKAQKIIDDVG